MSYFRKRILITGAAGFIGSHLAKRLVKTPCELICLDDLSTGSLDNIRDIFDQIKWLQHDIREPIDIPCDEIYHLACPASPAHYQKDSIKTIETSVLGSLNLLKLAKKHQAKIFFSSTSEVYGDPQENPQKESYLGCVNNLGPRACYDESKRLAETLFIEFYNNYGVNIRIARIFNTYGPFMNKDDGRVIVNFCHQAMGHQALTVYGDGTQTRSFCYIEDLIEGIVKLMDQDKIIGPINLGNPEEITIGDLAKIILEITQSKSKIVYRHLPQDDPKVRKPDISLAKKYLLWKPKVSLKEGLYKMLNFYGYSNHE